jgi:hypothetical protein
MIDGQRMAFATPPWNGWNGSTLDRLLEPIGHVPTAEFEDAYDKQLTCQARAVLWPRINSAVTLSDGNEL